MLSVLISYSVLSSNLKANKSNVMQDTFIQNIAKRVHNMVKGWAEKEDQLSRTAYSWIDGPPSPKRVEDHLDSY